MSDRDDDPILRELSALPARDVERALGLRVQRVARQTFEREHRAGRSEWMATATRVWSGVLFPAVLASAAVVYLTWAVSAANALYR